MGEAMPYISFILPAFNEEKYIENTIKSIREGSLRFPYEVVVVDHDSTDATALLAERQFAKVAKFIGGTISSVRNFGVKNSVGEILIFLDSDVTLTPQWFQNIEKAIEDLRKNPNIITGSHCGSPENGTWLDRFWYESYGDEENVTNLGTGHMIITRKLFDQIGGFDESLLTGEDYNICMRAIKGGGQIVNNTDLRAIHHGYPQSLLGFVRREIWHGRGDAVSLSNVVKSKVALVALLFFSMHLIAGGLFFFPGISMLTLAIPILGIVGIAVISSYVKFKHCRLIVILVNSLVFYFYFWGRVGSFLYVRSIN